MDKKTLNQIKWYLIIGIILLAISPYILTRSFGLISFDADTGVIGDTIGGITAPIANLIGSILVFFALQAQIEANKLIFDQFEYQKGEETSRKLNSYILEQIKLIREDIQEISRTETTTKTVNKERIEEVKYYKGVEGINKLLEAVSVMKHQTSEEEIIESIGHLTQVKLILERFLYILEECENKQLKDEDAKYLKSLVAYTYEYKIKIPLKEYEENRMSKVKPCENCGKKHNGIPEIIYEIYDKINEKILLTT